MEGLKSTSMWKFSREKEFQLCVFFHNAALIFNRRINFFFSHNPLMTFPTAFVLVLVSPTGEFSE